MTMRMMMRKKIHFLPISMPTMTTTFSIDRREIRVKIKGGTMDVVPLLAHELKVDFFTHLG